MLRFCIFLDRTAAETSGIYLSANAQRQIKFTSFQFNSGHTRGSAPRNPLAALLGVRNSSQDIIHCEHEQESLMAVEVALNGAVLARQTPLVLHSWQNILRQKALARAAGLRLHAARRSIRSVWQPGSGRCAGAGYRGGITLTNILGLDRRFFYPKPVPDLRARLQLEGVVIGYFGRRVPEKGIDTLLHAIPRLQARPQVVIGGRGPETDNLMALRTTVRYCRSMSFS